MGGHHLKTHKSFVLEAVDLYTPLPTVLASIVWEFVWEKGQCFCAVCRPKDRRAICRSLLRQENIDRTILSGDLRTIPGCNAIFRIGTSVAREVSVYCPDLIGEGMKLGCTIQVPSRKTEIFSIAGHLVSFTAVSPVKRHVYILRMDEVGLGCEWKKCGEIKFPSDRRPVGNNVVGCGERLYFFDVDSIFWLEPLTLKMGTIEVPRGYGSPTSLAAVDCCRLPHTIYACWCQPSGHFRLYRLDILDDVTDGYHRWTELSLPARARGRVALISCHTGLLSKYDDICLDSFPTIVERYESGNWTDCTADFNSGMALC